MKYIGAHISKDVNFLKTMHNIVEKHNVRHLSGTIIRGVANQTYNITNRTNQIFEYQGNL